MRYFLSFGFWFIVGFLFVIGFFLQASLVYANGHIIGHDKHDLNNPNHNYSYFCCNEQDCGEFGGELYPEATVEFEIDKETGQDGWRVVVPSVFINEFVSIDSDKIQEPIDGQWHVCIYNATSYDYGSGIRSIRCLYPPQGNV